MADSDWGGISTPHVRPLTQGVASMLVLWLWTGHRYCEDMGVSLPRTPLSCASVRSTQPLVRVFHIHQYQRFWRHQQTQTQGWLQRRVWCTYRDTEMGSRTNLMISGAAFWADIRDGDRCCVIPPCAYQMSGGELWHAGLNRPSGTIMCQLIPACSRCVAVPSTTYMPSCVCCHVCSHTYVHCAGLP